MSNNNSNPFNNDDQDLNKKTTEGESQKEQRDFTETNNYEMGKSGIEDAQYTAIDQTVTTDQHAPKPQGPTYYAYGNTRPMNAVQPTQSTMQGTSKAPFSSPAYSGQGTGDSYNGVYGGSSYSSSQGTSSAGYNYQQGSSYSSSINGAQPSNSSTGQPYRQYLGPSGGGELQPAKKEKKSGSGFGKMFLSFMAGVVAVGLLMYTADVQNWFSNSAAVSQESSYQSGSSNSGSTANGSGSTSGNRNTSLMTDRPDDIAELFGSASPAVVKIETYAQQSRSSGSSLFDDPFFRQFFGNNTPNSGTQESTGELVQTGMGTGFFFDEAGYILTNQHVVSDGTEIRVIVEGYDEPFIATLLGNNYDLDLAVLKIDGEQPFPTLPLGDSEATQIGDWVVAIGNPYGFDHTLTVGVISAKERPIDISDSEGTRNYTNLLQTDASINPGNSGGPLLNLNGEVIGINTAVSSSAQGIGFAIPTSTISEVLESLKNNEQPKSPFIGAGLQELTESLAQQLGVESTEGAIVGGVYYNSPAYNGDLKQYDVITAVDGQKIKNSEELIEYIKAQEVGQVIELTVIRKGEEIKLSIEIGDKNDFDL